MEKRNRNILLTLIGIVIVVAVFSSFGLPYFAGATPSIVLPTPQPTQNPEQGSWGETEGTRVEVTPETVQGVVAALRRQKSYTRTITTTLEGAVTTAGVWVDQDWVRTDLTTPGGSYIHTIVGDGSVWRWYGNDSRVLQWEADARSADVDGQRIPTYEDVLELEPERITAAGYEERNGLACVYVEAVWPELEQIERYWVSADNGLLEAAETEVAGELVWTMTASLPEIPGPVTDMPFTLPDGQVLHQRATGQRLSSQPEDAIAAE